MNLPNIFGIITLMITSSRYVSCLEREMTIQVNAKERECFFERIGEIRETFRELISHKLVCRTKFHH